MKIAAILSQPLQQVDHTHVLVRGRKLLYFGGCDYFRLSRHLRVHKALRSGLKQNGLNVSASRMTSGNHPLYEQLEKRLANFFGVESATLAANGWMPNLMAAESLAGQFSHVLLDERAHPSLAGASHLLDCPVIRFKHRDAEDVARIMERHGRINPLLMTDGLFSHDGGAAPLKEYLAILPRGGVVLVDDAHGAGVLGPTGRGTAQHAGASTSRIIQTITLSKAFGVFGGAVLGSRRLKSAIIARSSIFTGSTPLPLPLACAALESVAILNTNPRLRQQLEQNVACLRAQLRHRGFPVTETPGPIVAIIPRDTRESARLKRRLLASGILPPFVKYPGGPASGHFRFAISSAHSRAQLTTLANAFAIL